ncbi:hypothetical protein P7K49_036689 [Saguinus oedipus]|uniref:Uncharacterized protein n=1 Tax=Saguinus oedipus TaxID=9490 RepID=A0ABQ9TL08_SAGOE|nr:hypothetical protein P7K49_036689 [Saguinus oedipus]
MLDLECMKLKDACEKREVLTPMEAEQVALGSLQSTRTMTLEKSRIVETNTSPIWLSAATMGEEPSRKATFQPSKKSMMLSPYKRLLTYCAGKDPSYTQCFFLEGKIPVWIQNIPLQVEKEKDIRKQRTDVSRESQGKARKGKGI